MPSIKFSRIWKIAYPIIVGNVAQNLLIITDTAFLGHLDAISLGAAALGGVFYMAVMMLGMGFSIGVQIIVARRYGEERYDSIGSVFHHALLFIVPFALALWCLLRFAGNGILSHVVASPDVMNGVSQFLDMRIWGILFGFIIYVCQSFFVGIARTKIILPVTCTIVAVNILFDWAMIFGYLGFEAMGIRGAALASAISEMAGVVVYLFYICIFRKKDFREFGLFRRLSFSAATMRNLVKISVPASLQNFLSVASWFIFFAMVEKIGEQELAISNIGRSLYAIFLLPVWGFSSAVNSLVSYSIGCRKPLLIYPITGKAALITALSILLMEGLTYVFSDFVTSIYTNIPSLGEATVSIMPSICISALVFGISFICFNTISGTGNTHISLFIEIIATCIYIAICILAVETLHWGIRYVWLVDGFYGVVMVAASLLYLATGRWMKRKV
ncbi:MAG: MATE family efflux transporter [Bacteroidales bacterium]|jgi:putative MATE family efflux protein|nr:MATE family efflux transporter [Bacteroidales bacterium]